jgi:hypothetical protein
MWEKITKKSLKEYISIIQEKVFKDKILYDIEAVFLLLLPILITADKYLGVAGTVLTGIPFVLGILCVLLYQEKKRLKYIIMGVIFVINAYLIYDYGEQFEYIKSLLILFTCFDMVQDMEFLQTIKKYFELCNKFITYSIATILVLNGLVLLNGGITSQYADIWHMSTVFEGLYYDPNQAAYRLCVLIIYIMLLVKSNKNTPLANLIMLMASEIMLLQTGARTPTGLGIALGMIVVYFMRKDLLQFAKKYKKTAIAIIAVVLVILAVWLPKTAFIEKNVVSSEDTFDNGRAVLVTAGVKEFINCNILNKIFGNDINEIYKANNEAIHANVWSHNDVIQILLQFGLCMLVMYVETVVTAMLFLFKGQTKFEKFIIVLLGMTLLFVAFFNGLFYHPRFVVAIPVLYVVFKCYNENKVIEGENN